ncbi:MAG: glycosyltransferase, partial [Planctomycetota bacterium]
MAGNKNPLRVVHFGKFYPPHRGGMETVLAALCRGLAARGMDCRAVVSGDGGPRTSCDRGVRVHRMRSWGTLRSLPLCPEALWALRGFQADLIHLHHPNPLADLSRLFAGPRARLVVTYHSDVVRQRRLRRLH